MFRFDISIAHCLGGYFFRGHSVVYTNVWVGLTRRLLGRDSEAEDFSSLSQVFVGIVGALAPVYSLARRVPI